MHKYIDWFLFANAMQWRINFLFTNKYCFPVWYRSIINRECCNRDLIFSSSVQAFESKVGIRGIDPDNISHVPVVMAPFIMVFPFPDMDLVSKELAICIFRFKRIPCYFDTVMIQEFNVHIFRCSRWSWKVGEKDHFYQSSALNSQRWIHLTSLSLCTCVKQCWPYNDNNNSTLFKGATPRTTRLVEHVHERKYITKITIMSRIIKTTATFYQINSMYRHK